MIGVVLSGVVQCATAMTCCARHPVGEYDDKQCTFSVADSTKGVTPRWKRLFCCMGCYNLSKGKAYNGHTRHCRGQNGAAGSDRSGGRAGRNSLSRVRSRRNSGSRGRYTRHSPNVNERAYGGAAENASAPKSWLYLSNWRSGEEKWEPCDKGQAMVIQAAWDASQNNASWRDRSGVVEFEKDHRLTKNFNGIKNFLKVHRVGKWHGYAIRFVNHRRRLVTMERLLDKMNAEEAKVRAA